MAVPSNGEAKYLSDRPRKLQAPQSLDYCTANGGNVCVNVCRLDPIEAGIQSEFTYSNCLVRLIIVVGTLSLPPHTRTNYPARDFVISR